MIQNTHHHYHNLYQISSLIIFTDTTDGSIGMNLLQTGLYKTRLPSSS
jgi:hypothetical protein